MKRFQWMIVLAVAVVMLVSGAVTVYAVSADQSGARGGEAAPAEYAAEELAVGAYYEDLAHGTV